MSARTFARPADAPPDVEALRDDEGFIVTRVGSRWTYHFGSATNTPIAATEAQGFSGRAYIYGPFTEVAP